MLVLIGLWSGIGFCVVVYLAALQDIPRELVEAARMDGARRWACSARRAARAATGDGVPAAVADDRRRLQVFDLVFVTTKGGPLESTTVVVFYVWQQAFESFTAGYGAAAAYVLAFGLLLSHRRSLGVAGHEWCGDVTRCTARRHRAAAVQPVASVLAPLALLFALPLVWLVVSSVMTNAQINRFPPTIIPDALHLDGYRYVLEQRAVPALVPQLEHRARSSRWSANLVFGVARRLRVRAACGSAARSCCWR